MTTHLPTRHRQSDVRSFKNLSRRRTPLRMIQDLPPRMRKDSLSFLIPTRMHQVRSFHHVVDVVDWHFVLMKFLRKDDFPFPVFLPTMWREAWETSLHDAWTFRVARTTSFRSWSCRCYARGWENMFHPFFSRSDRRERLAELKFNLESCFVDAREIQNGRVVNEQCVTRSSALFLEKTMTNKGLLCCDLDLKKLQPVRQRRDELQGLEPLQDGWWKCFIHNEATILRDPTRAVERTLSI